MLRIARFLVVLALASFASIAPAAADCLDWDAVLPLVGDAGATDLRAVEVVQSWALAIDRTGYVQRTLRVYSLNDPEAPQLVTSLLLPDNATDILCRDDRAYIRTNRLLLIFDIHQPANPQELGRLTLPDDIHDFDVDGQLCALAADDSGLVLVDVADPQLLAVVGNFVPPSWQGDASAVDLRGPRALLGLDDNNDGYVYWLDVSDPSAPQVIGACAHNDPLDDVQLLDDTLEALATSDSRLLHVRLIDMGQPLVAPAGYTAGEFLFRFDHLALTMYWYDGSALLLDVADPAHPRWLASRAGFAFDAARKGQYLVLARGEAGLGVALITDPAEVPILGVEYGRVGGTRLFPTGDPSLILELEREYDGVRLVDVSVPSQPVARSLATLDAPAWATVQGSRALIVAAVGGVMLDISDPDVPFSLGPVALPAGTERVTWAGDRYYAAAGLAGMVILDATDPLHPVELGRFDTPGSVRNVALAGGHALVADNAEGLWVVDVDDPAHPAALGHVAGEMHGDQLAVDGARVFVGGSLLSNVVEVDLSDPAAPAMVATRPLPAPPNALLVHAGRLWAATYDGVHVFDVSSPGAPAPLADLGGRPPASGLAPVDDGVATCLWLFTVLRPPCATLTATPLAPAAAPLALRVAPNPGNPRATIAFALPQAADCRLTIHDLAGRLVAELWHGPLDAGPRTFVWNGENRAGSPVASGVYLARLAGTGVAAAAPITLVR